MAPVTPEEMRQLLADQEYRILRLIKAEVQPLKEQAQRIEVQVKATNGRVTHLEAWRIASDVRSEERARAVKDAAELVASKAAEALQARERSRKWWLGVVSAWGVSVGAISTVAGLLAQYLHHL